jgi:glycosyltransferase involved in cell wall biosynthesis
LTVTLVLLSFDEREALERLLPRIPFALFDRVLAIDPGSTDGTLELYRTAGIEIVIQERRGRGAAFQLAARIVETDAVVFFSTDGNEDPDDLPRIVELLRGGADQVIAGRFVARGAASDDSDDPLKLRKAGATTFGLLARLFFRTGVWDATNGYRGFSVPALHRLALDANGHDVEYQATIRAAKLGMKIVEFPTRELPRLGGFRKTTAGTLALGTVTLRCLVRELVT